MAARTARQTIEHEPLIQAFLRPPLRHTRYREGHGTLYTAVYRPADGVVDYCRAGSGWRQSFDDFRAGAHTVTLPLESRTAPEGRLRSRSSPSRALIAGTSEATTVTRQPR
ncbi:MAG TPA: hypothetical protein VEF72_30625 [Mycobacterium sp.]|nr:hypothetical protein [Mycobacterium sp.]